MSDKEITVPVSGEAESVEESLCDCGGIIKKGCDACNDCLNSFGDSAASVVINSLSGPATASGVGYAGGDGCANRSVSDASGDAK